MKCRVYQESSGELRIVTPNPHRQEEDESDDQFIARMAAHTEVGDPSLMGLPYIDIDESKLPTESNTRHKWRIKDGALAIDNAVPDRTDPRKQLIQRIDAATTIAQLKVLMKELVK